jgi:hypothetical protein
LNTYQTLDTPEFPPDLQNPEQQEQIAQLHQMVQQLQAELVQAQQQVQQAQAQQQAPPDQPAAQQPVPLHPNQVVIKPDKPANFSGRRNESVDSWLFQFQQYFALVPVPEDQQAFFAATFFKDNAALWWQSWVNAQFIVHGQPAQANWDEFAAAVRGQFKPVNADRIARERLANLRQTTSVAAYTHTFRTILLDLPNMNEADRLFAYIRGLKKEVAALVQVSNPITVAAAATTAENIDAVYWEHRARPTNHTWNTRNSRTNGPMPMELDNLNARRGPLTEGDRATLRKTGGCFYCREVGHIAKECPRKRRPINATEMVDNGEMSENELSQ